MRSEDIDRLIAVTAHELRSPLSTILGYQELLAEGLIGSIDKVAGDALGRIRAAALQLLAITHGLEVLAGALHEPELQAVSLGPVIDDVAGRMSADAAARGIDIDFDAPPDVPVMAEPDTLPHALELAIYACLKARAGERLRVRYDSDGQHVLVHLTGDAVGLLPEPSLRPLRDEGGLDSALDGVGLRFAIVRRAIERIGGDFTRTDAHAGALTMRLRAAEPPGGRGAVDG